MHAASTLLAVLLLGGDPRPASPDHAADEGVRVQFRLLTMKSLDWRGTLHHRLVPAARQGTATIWTARGDVVETLRKAADATVQGPIVCAALGAPVHIEDARVVSVVAGLRRMADGPPGENTSLAYTPEVDALRDGFEADVSCRKVDQGLMVRLACKDSRVAAIHTYAIQDGATDPKTKVVTPVRAQIQVPEVVSNQAEGEWLVPTDGVLVVSLGAFTCDDGHGKASTRERVAIIEPRLPKDDPEVARSRFAPAATPDLARPYHQGSMVLPVAPPAPIGTSMLLPIASPTIAPKADEKPAGKTSITVTAVAVPGFPLPFFTFGAMTDAAEAGPTAKLPTAAPPGRTLPTPIAADGTVVPLPTLPDDEVQPATTSPEGKAQPAPQARPASSSDAPRPQAEAIPPAPPIDRPVRANHSAWAGAELGIGELKLKTRFNARGHQEIVCNDLILYPAPDASRDDRAWDNLADPSSLPQLPAGGCEAPMVSGDRLNVTLTRRESRIDPSILPALFPNEPFWGSGPAFRCAACRWAGEIDLSPGDGADDACLAETGSLDFQVKTAEGDCRYDGRVRLKMIGADPVVARVPMADGSVVEIQAKVVKKPAGGN